LGGFAGESAFSIRFRFESDGGYETVGMLIDDFVITTSAEDNAAPLVIHEGPTFYEGTDGDFEVVAEIIDISGVESASVIYTVDDGEEIEVPFDSNDGNTYYFYIPAQDAGYQVDYVIAATDASDNDNYGETEGFVYIAGHHLIYDNGVVDFYDFVDAPNGFAVRMDSESGLAMNLKYALIRNYTDQSGQDNDDMEVHVWADDGGVPGADLIEPFIVTPEATYENTRPMTRIDLRDFAEQLSNLEEDFYIGFTVPVGRVHIVETSPANYENSFQLAGSTWMATAYDYHFRGVIEWGGSVPQGTVQGTVTDADTGDPLAGASISVGPYSTETDAAGWYSIVANTGDYTLTCEMTEYLPYVEDISIEEDVTLTIDIGMVHYFAPPANLTTQVSPQGVVLQWDEP
ncbi:MAG: carboxypeptidase regulatory-like domain-containing protein, partial [Planctomycetes bacterium]|nr:carboxypeptidase regulatory-like domain-containing protein [Planctomycetota bacterium]